MPDAKIAQAIQQSIDFAVGENVVDEIVGQPIIPWLAKAHSIVPPWWSYARDAYLRDFWKRSSHLSFMMYTAQTLLANTPMRVEAKNPAISSHVEQAELYEELLWKASEFGETFFASKAKFAEDILSQDNGGFMEVLGDGRPDGPIEGPPVAVRHLDAQACWRTRNPTYPVVYHDPNDGGKAYKLHSTRVIFMSQMPSSDVTMNSVGFSAVSRSLQFAQHLYDIYLYKQEKLGSRPISKIVVGSGFLGSHIMRAVAVANEMMNNQSLSRYSKVVGIGSEDVGAKLSALDLNDFDPFDEEVSVLYAVIGMSASFGIPVQEVWPIGGKGGRAGDQQESRQRGKLPAEFNAQLAMQLSRKYLPPYLRMVADWRDDYQDERRAVNQDIRARNRERNLGSGVVNISTSRRIMVEDGDLTRKQFADLELADGRLEDGTSVLRLFYDDDPTMARILDLGVELPTAVSLNDPATMLDTIDVARARAEQVLSETSSQRKADKIVKAISALDHLEEQYRSALARNRLAGEQDGKPAEEQAGEETGEETGEEAVEEASEEAGEEAAGEASTRDPDEVRPGTLERLAKQVNDSALLEFLVTMEAELLEELQKDNPSEDRLKQIVVGWLLFAYLEGIGKSSESELTDEEASDIAEEEELFLSQIKVIFERKASGNNMAGTVRRLLSQAARLFWVGFVKADGEEDRLEWILGATEQHCSDCGSLAGEVRTRSEWAKSPLLPQSPALECTGYHCLCELVRVS